MSKPAQNKLPLEFIDSIKEYIKPGAEDMAAELLASYLEANEKKYGLIYEKSTENIELKIDDCHPVLKEIKQLAIKRGGTHNQIIEGDNLAALNILERNYKNKVDVIYIDPPYNTKNRDFMYNDTFVSGDDLYKHSTWLSFMEKRLVPARNLLAQHGVIFISIDDNELAQLKLLCDEIFGGQNFVAILPRVTKKSGKDHADDIARNHDYVLIYVKNRSVSSFCGIKSDESDYPFRDEYYESRGGYKLNQTLDYNSLWYNPKMDFPIELDGVTYYPGGSFDEHKKRHSGLHNAKDWVWRWSMDKFLFGLENGFIVLKKGKSFPRIYTKTYARATISAKKPYKVEIKQRYTPLSSIALTDNKYSNDNAKKEITKLGLEGFGFPKPTSLIEQLLRITKKSDLVLDFFAGSGTTGQAVLKLNAEDGGNRRFILCTNNENNICRDITYERIKRSVLGGGYCADVKYFQIKFLPRRNKNGFKTYRKTEEF